MDCRNAMASKIRMAAFVLYLPLIIPTYSQTLPSRLSILDTINMLLSPPGGTSSNQGPSVSLVESWEPVRDATLTTGTQSDPLASTGTGSVSTAAASTSGSGSTSGSAPPVGASAGSGTMSAGASIAQLFSSPGTPSSNTTLFTSPILPAGASSTAVNPGANNDVVQPPLATASGQARTSPSASAAAHNSSSSGSLPLANDILSQIARMVNQGLQTTFGGSGNSLATSGLATTSIDPWLSRGPVGVSGVDISALAPLRNQVLLNAGRRAGDRLYIAQYYDVHGCADPVALFSGPDKLMATMAMAQGCHTFQAMHVCKMAQVKERMGNSHITSNFLPPNIQQRLEGCLSAKVLFDPLGSSSGSVGGGGMGGLMAASAGVLGDQSVAECGLLFSMVMDGGALDPESMSLTRRQILPWSCNESTGSTGIPYRVCCPGKVPQPTLVEANVLDGMLNA